MKVVLGQRDYTRHKGGIKQGKSVGEDKMQRKHGEKKAVLPLQLARIIK